MKEWRTTRRALAVVLALWAAGAGAAEAPVSAQLVVHPDDRLAAGEVRVGVLLEMAPGWHVYAEEPGETGLPTEVQWRAPGARVGPLHWPEPEVFRDAGLTAYGYEEELLLWSELTPAGEGTPERVEAEVSYLACQVECIPGSASLSRDLSEPLPPALAVRARQAFAPAGTGPALPLRIALLALLGGLVLNLMPCVLPVLALKVFAVAELAQHGRREALRHGLAYLGGVLLSMQVLGGAVIALRAAGSAVGWGFQFQEPLFLAGLCAVVVLFALNLFGVFEIGGPGGSLASIGARSQGAARSFFDGLLAVVLATPCSAPFLGTAVGFAFAGSAVTILAVFAAVGLGLAAPFLLVTCVPGARRLVPRSGPWMGQLRAALGFALLATGVWLVWLLGRAVGSDGVAQLLGGLVGLSFAAWVYGSAAVALRRRLRVAGGLVAAGLAFATVGTVQLEPGGPGSNGAAGPDSWPSFAPAAVAERLADGQPVLVSFTADWCLTCKVNERLVLADARVHDALDELGVAPFRADWTRRDEEIRAELARFGRAGVPLYLVYDPGAPQTPEVLPELLSVERVLAALRRAAPEVTAVTRPQAGANDEQRT